ENEREIIPVGRAVIWWPLDFVWDNNEHRICVLTIGEWNNRPRPSTAAPLVRDEVWDQVHAILSLGDEIAFDFTTFWGPASYTTYAENIRKLEPKGIYTDVKNRVPLEDIFKKYKEE